MGAEPGGVGDVVVVDDHSGTATSPYAIQEAGHVDHTAQSLIRRFRFRVRLSRKSPAVGGSGVSTGVSFRPARAGERRGGGGGCCSAGGGGGSGGGAAQAAARAWR